MGALSDDKSTANSKAGAKLLTEGRPNKVVKKTKEKKVLKGLDLDVVIEAAEQTSSGCDDALDIKEKKPQGIVIDGRTYTCATCKTGHRVGICKHANERPMTATHPPGRPPAGAPKKVVCDCPKQCNCKKRDCRCVRNCSCTQTMFMLVYVPAPGEGDDPSDEKGIWKVDRPVLTDLKGNILSEEEIKMRREQKEASKSHVLDSRTASVSTTVSSSTLTSLATVTSLDSVSNAPSKSEFPTSQTGGCCKHKENIVTRNVAVEASPKTGRISASAASGCNCGTACSCAFCPQHPNNSISRNIALQQASHFANHQYNNETVLPIMQPMSQRASCMGGPPQFAMHRFGEMPSSHDIRGLFPNPGYVIGYPVSFNRLDLPSFDPGSFTAQRDYIPDMRTLPTPGLSEYQTPVAPHSGMNNTNYSQDDFILGDATVAASGAQGWGSSLMSPNMWAMDDPVLTPVTDNFMTTTDYLGPSIERVEMPTASVQHNSDFDLNSAFHVNHRNSFPVISTATHTPQVADSIHHAPRRKTCCDASSMVPNDTNEFVDDYFSPMREYAAPIYIKPQG